MQQRNHKETLAEAPPIHLEDFLPYRLSVLSNTISSAIAGAYSRRFGLTISEWRIIAVLARFAGISAAEVAEKTAMDKVAVSRALARLRDGGFVRRTLASEDRRRSVLHLSGKGRELYGKVAPLALGYEQELLEGFSDSDLASLDSALSRLLQKARTLGPLGEG